MRRLEISLLGTFTVELDGERITDFGYDKVRALLAYLSVEGRQPQRRDTLVGLLWPEQSQSQALTSLRTALYRLRGVLGDRDAGPPFLLVARDSLQLNPDAVIEVDATRFADLASESRHHGHDLGHDCPECVRAMTVAMALYYGDFLPGFALESAPFEEWSMLERETLHGQALDLLDRLAVHHEVQGAFDQVLIHAQREIQLEPWRERAHRQAMRALAFSGQRAAAVAQFEICCEVLSRELGVEPEPVTVALYEKLLSSEPLLPPTARDLVIEREWRRVGPCPYRGLSAFREADAAHFFGRDEFVNRLFHAIDTPPHVAVVVGPSGSGKSSVVFAGLLPRLRDQGGWAITSLRPGREPFEALAGAFAPRLAPHSDAAERVVQTRELARMLESGEVSLTDLVAHWREREEDAVQVLLVVDQLEELYTLCPDTDTRVRFIDTLWDAVTVTQNIDEDRGPVALVLALRADFMGQALAHRPFADALQTMAQMLGPMTREELREAIEKPAAAQGTVFEAGLVDRLLDDVGGQGGSLPLLEFALTRLWHRLDRGWLTHAAYKAIGQVHGALTRYAQEVYEALSETDRALCRRIFTQLVQPGEGTEDTRRLATRAEVGDEAWTLVQHLADRRLVVTGRDVLTGDETAEVAHEALIQHWDQLQAWMAEDRAFRTWQERLRISVGAWEATERDEGALLRGAPLVEAENWLATRAQDFSQAEHIFVEESVALRERRAAEREARLERERAAARQLAEAHEQALHQAAVGLAAEARIQMQGPDQDLAVLLALEALQSYPYAWQAERALAEVALDWRLVWQFSGQGPIASPAKISPDGTRFLIAHHDGVLRVWDLRTREEMLTVQAYQGIAGERHWAIWSPRGDRILTCTLWVGGPRIWDAETGELLVELPVTGGVADWSLDGTQILTCPGEHGTTVTLWDARSGKRIHVLPSDESRVRWAFFSPDSRWVATSLCQIWNTKTGDLIHTLAACRDLITSDDQPALVWAPRGSRVGTAMGGTVRVWDAETGEEVLTADIGYAGGADLWWSPEGDRFLTTGYSGEGSPAALWDAKTGERLHELPYYDEMHFVTDPWSPDGRLIALIDAQGYVAVYDVASGREQLRLRASHNNAHVNWLADGSSFVTTGMDGRIRIWRISTAEFTTSCSEGAMVCSTPGFRTPIWLRDGTKVGRNFTDGTVRIWDLASGAEALLLQKRDQKGTPVVVNWMAQSPEGERILTGALNGDVDIWDSTTGEHLLSFRGHSHVVLGVAWSPDGRRALSCSRDRTAVVWDTVTGAALTEFTGQDFYWGAWSPDGKRIVLVDQFSFGGPVRVWDPSTGEALLTLLPDDFAYGTHSAAWSPDGARIVTFSFDELGRLWDADDGELLAAFPAQRYSIGAEWSPSGRRFLVGGIDGTDVYDAASLEAVIVYPADGEAEARWSPDGKHIAVAYPNGDLKVHLAWESLEDLIAYAKAHCVLRDLTPEERARFGLPAR